MTRTHSLILLAAAIAASVVTGCAPPFPKDLLDRTEKNVSFAALQKEPERFSGKLLMLGGTIADTKNLKAGTQIEVLQKPLDGGGKPAVPAVRQAGDGRIVVLRLLRRAAGVMERAPRRGADGRERAVRAGQAEAGGERHAVYRLRELRG